MSVANFFSWVFPKKTQVKEPVFTEGLKVIEFTDGYGVRCRTTYENSLGNIQQVSGYIRRDQFCRFSLYDPSMTSYIKEYCLFPTREAAEQFMLENDDFIDGLHDLYNKVVEEQKQENLLEKELLRAEQ